MQVIRDDGQHGKGPQPIKSGHISLTALNWLGHYSPPHRCPRPHGRSPTGQHPGRVNVAGAPRPAALTSGSKTVIRLDRFATLMRKIPAVTQARGVSAYCVSRFWAR